MNRTRPDTRQDWVLVKEKKNTFSTHIYEIVLCTCILIEWNWKYTYVNMHKMKGDKKYSHTYIHTYINKYI